jgi:hypothetical protein
MDQKEAIQNTEPENLKVTSSSITKNPSNTKFYLIATFIFLVIVSIAASFIYMNKNEHRKRPESFKWWWWWWWCYCFWR